MGSNDRKKVNGVDEYKIIWSEFTINEIKTLAKL